MKTEYWELTRDLYNAVYKKIVRLLVDSRRQPRIGYFRRSPFYAPKDLNCIGELSF